MSVRLAGAEVHRQHLVEEAVREAGGEVQRRDRAASCSARARAVAPRGRRPRRRWGKGAGTGCGNEKGAPARRRAEYERPRTAGYVGRCRTRRPRSPRWSSFPCCSPACSSACSRSPTAALLRRLRERHPPRSGRSSRARAGRAAPFAGGRRVARFLRAGQHYTVNDADLAAAGQLRVVTWRAARGGRAAGDRGLPTFREKVAVAGSSARRDETAPRTSAGGLCLPAHSPSLLVRGVRRGLCAARGADAAALPAKLRGAFRTCRESREPLYEPRVCDRGRRGRRGGRRRRRRGRRVSRLAGLRRSRRAAPAAAPRLPSPRGWWRGAWGPCAPCACTGRTRWGPAAPPPPACRPGGRPRRSSEAWVSRVAVESRRSPR